MEPAEPRNADYFEAHGLSVVRRAYGTRVYAEMFTVLGVDYEPLLEVRRQPLSVIGAGGVLPRGACHVRLCNRTCYFSDAVLRLKQFLYEHQLDIVRVSRADICLDFEKFDSGDKPHAFLQRYVRGKYSKINQALVHAHGTDKWDGRDWQSISWGKPKSPIGTKIYNKTKELAEVHDKPYIRLAWWQAGLVDNPQTLERIGDDGVSYRPDIYRLEFSIRSSVKNWATLERDGNEGDYVSVRNTVDIYASHECMLELFANLVSHYFHFKKFRSDKTKYECPDKKLFDFSSSDIVIKVEHPSTNCKPDSLLQRLMLLLRAYKERTSDPAIVKQIDALIASLQDRDMMRLCANPYSREQLLALQLAIAAKIGSRTADPAEEVRNIEAELKALSGKIF